MRALDWFTYINITQRFFLKKIEEKPSENLQTRPPTLTYSVLKISLFYFLHYTTSYDFMYCHILWKKIKRMSDRWNPHFISICFAESTMLRGFECLAIASMIWNAHFIRWSINFKALHVAFLLLETEGNLYHDVIWLISLLLDTCRVRYSILELDESSFFSRIMIQMLHTT